MIRFLKNMLCLDSERTAISDCHLKALIFPEVTFTINKARLGNPSRSRMFLSRPFETVRVN